MTRAAGRGLAGRSPAVPGFTGAMKTFGLAGLCIAGSFAVFCLPISNPDIYWHLSAGRWMAEHGTVPSVDWLSYTLEGQAWRDFEWLTQLLWHGVHALGGFTGLWALKVSALSLCAGLLFQALGFYGLTPAGRAAGVFFWALAISPANDLRPENYSVIGFLLLWLYLEDRRLKGWRRSLSLREGMTVCLFFAVWANMHAGFVYGLLLLGIFAAGAWLRGNRGPALVVLASSAAVLVNPYGHAVYSVIWQHWSVLPILEENLREWQESSVLGLWLRPFWGVLIVSFGAVLRRQLKRRDVPLEHVAALCLFGWSASAHVRTIIYFVTVAIPVAACALSDRSRRWVLAAALTCAGLFFFINIVPPLLRRERVRHDYVPVSATRFLVRESGTLAGRKLLHPWHWGGYLGYALYPAFKVFVDGRYIFHPFLTRMSEARQEPEAYRRLLDQYGVEVAVLQRTGQSMPMKDGAQVLMRPFYLYYLPRQFWALVFWDSQALVFVRRSRFPPEWVGREEYRYFRPGDMEAAQRLVLQGHISRADLAGEVDRHYAQRDDKGEEAAARRWLESLR